MQTHAGVGGRSSFVRHLRSRKASACRLRCRVQSRPLCFGGRFNEGRRRSHERLLRYPNGDTRLIRYPATESEAEPEIEVKAETQSTTHHLPAPLKSTELPSSPAELVRLIRSSSYIKAQEEHRQRIRDSYQILESDPWRAPQKLYVLTVEDKKDDVAKMFTLRTRLHRADVTQRLKKMFRGADFKGDFIQVDRIADGVIAFVDHDNAERFRALVEAEGTHKINLCEISSHELFRGTFGVGGVVVLLHSHDYCPTVAELTSCLKSQPSLD